MAMESPINQRPETSWIVQHLGILGILGIDGHRAIPRKQTLSAPGFPAQETRRCREKGHWLSGGTVRRDQRSKRWRSVLNQGGNRCCNDVCNCLFFLENRPQKLWWCVYPCKSQGREAPQAGLCSEMQRRCHYWSLHRYHLCININILQCMQA